jgi:hypothetical protein
VLWKRRGLNVKFFDFPRILESFMYWKFCGLGAWVMDRDLVSVHHGLAEVMTTRFTRDGRPSNSGGWDLAAGLREAKEGQLVHYYGCRCAEG